MNDEQLRQLLLADPESDNIHLQRAMVQDAKLKSFADELRMQNKHLSDALQVPVPPLLTEQLLALPTEHNEHKKRPQRWLAAIAMAASISVLAVVGVQWMQQVNYSADLGSHALAHVHYEHDYLVEHASVQPMQEVNSKLAAFNAALQNWQDDIIYARFCTFQGTRSLHLAVKTATGYATIFVVPKEAELAFVAEFADKQYMGRSIAMPGANVIVVSSDTTDLKQIPQKLSEKLIFQA